jgi:hypothetical protein
MGCTTDSQGRLCCDHCDAAPARTYPCPYGVCQGINLCKDCVPKVDHGTAWHDRQGCRQAMIDARFAQVQRRALLRQEGAFVLVSVLRHEHPDGTPDSDFLRLVFIDRDEHTKELVVPASAYATIQQQRNTLTYDDALAVTTSSEQDPVTVHSGSLVHGDRSTE